MSNDIITYITNDGGSALITGAEKPSIVLDLPDDIEVEVIDGLDNSKAMLIIKKNNGVTLSLRIGDGAGLALSREMINVCRIRNGAPIIDVEALFEDVVRKLRDGETFD